MRQYYVDHFCLIASTYSTKIPVFGI